MESEKAQSLVGLRAKLYHKKRYHEKIQIKKQIKTHEERNVKSSTPTEPSSTPLPQYLLDRSNPTNTKALNSQYVEFLVANSTNWCALTNLDVVKNNQNEKAAKFSVPLPKVRVLLKKKYSRSLRPERRLRRRVGISIFYFLRH